METLHQNANHLKSVSLDWDEVFSPEPLPEPETDARTIFRECLGEVATAAKRKLPDSESRINKAVAILINNDCIAHEPVTDTSGEVVCHFNVGSSQDVTSHMVTHSDPDGWVCDCADAADKAPQGRCKHIFASMMWLKTHAMTQERTAHFEVGEHGNGTGGVQRCGAASRGPGLCQHPRRDQWQALPDHPQRSR